MESRKITVVETKNQKKSVIMSAATTLAELKNDLRANGIDYTNMTFFEGTAKVELLNDDAILPHDVPYKGTITNELVFMLTNTNKKIKSGANSERTEAYEMIKSLGLQAVCVEKFGKNFTMCKTADLISLIKDTKSKAPVIVVESDKKEDKVCACTTVKEALEDLVNILEENCAISEAEKDRVLSHILCNSSVKHTNLQKSSSPYSDDEIDDMFSFVQ